MYLKIAQACNGFTAIRLKAYGMQQLKSYLRLALNTGSDIMYKIIAVSPKISW